MRAARNRLLRPASAGRASTCGQPRPLIDRCPPARRSSPHTARDPVSLAQRSAEERGHLPVADPLSRPNVALDAHAVSRTFLHEPGDPCIDARGRRRNGSHHSSSHSHTSWEKPASGSSPLRWADWIHPRGTLPLRAYSGANQRTFGPAAADPRLTMSAWSVAEDSRAILDPLPEGRRPSKRGVADQ